MSSIMPTVQKIGRSFMLPIAMLPAVGILLGVGGSFTNPETLKSFPILDIPLLQNLFHILVGVGGVIFGNLPLIFAIAIPVGMVKAERGTAALAGAVAFLVMHQTIAVILTMIDITSLPAGSLSDVLGIHSLQMGVFGGIIAGFGATMLHNKYYDIELPAYLAFFSGTRFVPIITSGTFVIIGIICALVWPFIQANVIGNLGILVTKTGLFGTFIYGVIERALIPLGLHHIFYLPFWQTALGGSMEVCGQTVNGAQNIFFSQLACSSDAAAGIPFEVTEGTRFMAGKFPFMMFGLPAAALAMYHAARPERKAIVGGIFLSAALTSFLTGITEPIEFTFLFVAPILYVVHCIFAGISFMLMDWLQVGVGQTFSGGAIDFTLFGILQGTARTNWYWIPIVGSAYAVIYYFGFSAVIRIFNLATPGRENASDELITRTTYNESKGEDKATKVLASIGGKENITSIDACITRLRLEIKDKSLIKEDELKNLGARGVVFLGDHGVQIIYGPEADVLKTKIKKLL